MGILGVLALLFVIVPIAELAILIQIGQAFGLGPTLLLVLTTGVAGAVLARSQGLRTLLKFREEVATGGVPSTSISDGASVLVGGALLLTPGLLTDLLGFALLVPFSRRWIQKLVRARMARMVKDGTIRVVTVPPTMSGWPPGPTAQDSRPGPGLDPANEIVIGGSEEQL